MGLGQKKTFVGFVKRHQGDIVLDTGTSAPMSISLGGFNPVADAKILETFVGQRVRIDGVQSLTTICINDASDIKILPPLDTAKKQRPPRL